MKLKNTLKDDRILRDHGQVIVVGAGKTVEVSHPIYDPTVFKEVNTQEKSEEIEPEAAEVVKKTTKEEDK